MSDKTRQYGEKLKKLLDQNNMNQRDLARELYLTDTAVSNYVSGRRLPRYEITVKIANYFNVTADYLLGIDPKNKEKVFIEENIKIPVFKELKYSDEINEKNPNVEFIFPVVAERYKTNNKLFAKIVTTDEMYPRIMIGDIIIFEELKLGTDKIYNGDICLVSKGNDYVKIREIANTNDGYVFNPFNTNMPPRVYDMNRIRKENVHIIGRAIKLIHEFPKRGE